MILMCLLGSLTWDTCRKNSGGLFPMAYYGEIKDIDTFPAPLAIPVALGDGVKALGDIEMAVGKKMFELYTTQDTAEVSDESVGEIDGKSFESYFEAFTPGTHAEVLDWAATINNGNWFFVPKERGGNMRIIGGPDNPAKIDTLSIKTGKDAKGRRGCTFKVKTFGETPAWIYESQTIPLV